MTFVDFVVAFVVGIVFWWGVSRLYARYKKTERSEGARGAIKK